MPYTFPCWVCSANLLSIRPPPQPTSRIVSFPPIEMHARPQSVSSECREFMFRRIQRPSHPRGFLHWLSRPVLTPISIPSSHGSGSVRLWLSPYYTYFAYQRDVEGIVAKRKFDPYLLDGSRTWFKIRNRSHSLWIGREELFERERECNPDCRFWNMCATASCELIDTHHGRSI